MEYSDESHSDMMFSEESGENSGDSYTFRVRKFERLSGN